MLRFRCLELARPSVAPCGRLLAEAGLEVIKIEPPGGADDPSWSPRLEVGGRQISAFSLYHDTGKQAITLDLTRSEGAELFLRLVEQSDLVLEGLRPGELAELGLSYDQLRRRNPDLVLLSITPFGQDGPYSSFAANDLVVFAMGGIMFISGLPGEAPVTAPDQQAYAVAGMHGAIAALSALWSQSATGSGEWIDVSMFECLAAQENTLTNFLGPGQFTRRNGTQHRTALPGCILPCRDGFVHVFVSREVRDWERFLAWIGHPPELTDPALADVNVRWRHAEEIMAITDAFVRDRTRSELYRSAQAAHMPLAPIYDLSDFFGDPQTESRDPLVTVPTSDGASYQTLRPPMGLGVANPAEARSTGADNSKIYASLAGVRPAELQSMAEAGLV